MPMKIKDIIQGLGDVKLADFDPFHKDSSKAKSNDGKGGGDDEHDVFEDKESRTLDAEFKARLEKAKQGAHRLKDVFAAPIQMVADFIPPVYPKSDDEKAFINKALGDSFVFSHLGARERTTLIDAFEPVEVSEGEIIIKQGDIGDYFYVLQKGKVQYVVDGLAVGDASAGDTFGEIALLHDCPRAATCLALSNCGLFRVGQKTFRRILMSYAMKYDDETKKLLTKVEFFKDLDDRALAKVASALSVVSFKKGDVIARKGDEGKTFYIIQKGKIGASDILLGGTKYDDLVLGPGDHFGEGAIVKNIPVMATVTALEDSTALVMSKENFQQSIGDFKALFQIGWDRKKLQAIPLANGQKLSSQETDMLSSLIVNETYPKGHVFYQEGTSANPYLFLIRSGKVDITTSFMGIEFLTGIKAHKGETKSIGQDGFFGEDMLNPDTKDAGAKAHPRYTAVAAEECVVGVLSLKTIVSVIASAAGSGLALSDLEKHKLLGAGTFGKVFLVTKKGTKDAYALKIQYKKQLIEYGQAAGVIRERDVMAKLDHPLIIKLVTSYQDEKHVYMLMKLYLGGELRSVMQNRRRNFLPEWAARFYAAGVLEGLGYMHRRHIVYRDLKPENVLLDSDGYTVIVDLGFAKYVPTKTYTFCGTPLYLAPEIILQRGHDKSADLWSWGVMLYEMIVGFTPFWNDDMDQHALMKAIVKGEFDFPTGNFMSENSKSLIRAMLTVNVKHRLGCFAAGDLDIRNHPFFREIDWTLLAKKEAKAPMVPKIKDPLDANNFRNWKDEAKEDDGKPLTAKQQKLFKDF